MKKQEMLDARREFLAKCGKFAVVTPPTIGLLLSTASRTYAVAHSGGGNWGGGGKPPMSDDRGHGDDNHAGDPDHGHAGGPEH